MTEERREGRCLSTNEIITMMKEHPDPSIRRTGASLERLSSQAAPESTDEELAALRTKQLEEAWLDAAPKIGVPYILLGAQLGDAFDGIVPAAMLYAVQYMRDDFPRRRALILMGDVGRGKSHAAAACLRAVPEKGRQFIDFPRFCGALLSPSREEQALRLAEQTYFVVFDDFGAEYLKRGGALEAKLDGIISYREGNRLPTIFTTNLSKEQLFGVRAHLSERLQSRLGGVWTVGFNCLGPDIRVAMKRNTR